MPTVLPSGFSTSATPTGPGAVSHDEPHRGLSVWRGPGAGWVLKLAAAQPVKEPPDPGHGQEASGGQDA